MNDQEYTLFGIAIERLKRPFCEKCADLWKKEQFRFCYNCHNEMDTLYFGIVRAPGIFRPKERGDDYLSEVIRTFKYKDIPACKRQRIAEEFADLLYKYVLDEHEIINGVHLLVPIPMTEAKEREKGFNHTSMIIDKFSEKVDIQIEHNNLIKIRETKPQTGLNRAERRDNVKGAFEVKQYHRFKGKKILLVDDVATTCSTIDECAKVLKDAGAQEVNALVLARDTQSQGDSHE
jgi:ComF family protein